MLPIQKMIVPTDFSENSHRAMLAACELAKKFESELILVHVYTPVVAALPDGYLMMREGAQTELNRYIETTLTNAQKEAEAILGRPVRREMLLGRDFEEIAHFAEAEKADLIVIGSQGRGAFSRFFLGSVTERVLRKTNCNVLVIRHEEKAETPSAS
jgi:nucleotide-binding universal stress UspA family protein